MEPSWARHGWLAFVVMAAFGMSWHQSTKPMLLSGPNNDKDGHDLTRIEHLCMQCYPGEADLGSSPQSKEKVAKDWAGQNFAIVFIHPEGFLIFLTLSALNHSLFRNVSFNFHITCEFLKKKPLLLSILISLLCGWESVLYFIAFHIHWGLFYELGCILSPAMSLVYLRIHNQLLLSGCSTEV